MAVLGQLQSLRLVRHARPGAYLEGGTYGEILLPKRYVPPEIQEGDEIEVFVYRDSEDRPVATTERPLAVVGEFALLRVVACHHNSGAFLDWGLEKDLLLPMREHVGPVRPGGEVLVRVAMDERSDRIIASARLNRWLNKSRPNYVAGQAVKLLIEKETPLGWSAIVNHAHRGLLYRTELAGPLRVGQVLDGFVRAVRADDRIDLSLDRSGHQRIAPLTEQILEALQGADGFLPYHDGSSPEEIREAFGVSKKAFKQAIGILYRKRKVEIRQDGIKLSGGTAPRCR